MYYVWLLRYLAQLVKQEMHLEAKYDPNVDTWKAHKHMYSHIHTANSGRSEKQLGTYLCIYLIICVFTWLLFRKTTLWKPYQSIKFVYEKDM